MTFGTRLPDGAKGLDIGPGTAAEFGDVVMDSRTTFWNGPMGMFEDERFAAGTQGGGRGDGRHQGLHRGRRRRLRRRPRRVRARRRIDHMSTGGGASLELLELGDLPGLAALREAAARG